MTVEEDRLEDGRAAGVRILGYYDVLSIGVTAGTGITASTTSQSQRAASEAGRAISAADCGELLCEDLCLVVCAGPCVGAAMGGSSEGGEG